MAATTGMPSPPAGTHFEIRPAEQLDGDSFLSVFYIPRRTSLTVWLRSTGFSSTFDASSFARPNDRSIARAARRAIKRHHANVRQSAKRAAERTSRAAELARWTDARN